MKSAAETLGPTRVKLTVEVPFDELRPTLDAAYKKIGRQLQVPGFRKGKVPPAIVDQRLGRGAVLDEAVNDALPTLYVQALRDNDLQPLGRPEVDVTKFADGDALEFTAEVDVRPDIELPDYVGLKAEVPTVEVTDDDVDEQVQA
ncbi:MAG: trigger factor, partial [Actinomycetota bacterium]|nr:trigger factor [Actinomycetota bacterium]